MSLDNMYVYIKKIKALQMKSRTRVKNRPKKCLATTLCYDMT